MKGYQRTNEILPRASVNKVKGCEEQGREHKVRKRGERQAVLKQIEACKSPPQSISTGFFLPPFTEWNKISSTCITYAFQLSRCVLLQTNNCSEIRLAFEKGTSYVKRICHEFQGENRTNPYKKKVREEKT
jgi:hypothetical protein